MKRPINKRQSAAAHHVMLCCNSSKTLIHTNAASVATNKGFPSGLSTNSPSKVAAALYTQSATLIHAIRSLSPSLVRSCQLVHIMNVSSFTHEIN